MLGQELLEGWFSFQQPRANGGVFQFPIRGVPGFDPFYDWAELDDGLGRRFEGENCVEEAQGVDGGQRGEDGQADACPEVSWLMAPFKVERRHPV